MINFVFAAFNFMLFCVCCVWLFKRQKPSVIHEMEQERVRAERLIEYRDGLIKQLNEVNAQAKAQTLACDDVSQKIQLWKKNFDEQQAQDRSMHEALEKKVHQTYLKQMHFRQREMYQQRVTQAVLADVRQQLQKKYSSFPAKDQYNEVCLRLLERKGSL